VVDELFAAANARGAVVSEHAPGHFQIRGTFLVNYYPFSKRRSAFVHGTPTQTDLTPSQAVELAFQATGGRIKARR
jgi:hypothetical protein